MRESSSTLSTSVFDQIKNEIIGGQLPQGSKIVETELAKKFNISRGPLREALHKLENINLIVKKPHSSTQVVTVDFDLMKQVYQMRIVMEGYAARLAAENMTDKEIQGLKDLLNTHKDSIENAGGESYIQKEGDVDFHYYIFSKCGNELLANYLESKVYQLVRMCRIRTSTMKDRVALAYNEHSKIVDAISNRDGEFAEMLMRKHISGAWETIMKLQETQGDS
ncbi:MAG: GntR family transcriptional regulator [Gammaproteobacteria bacterium]